MTTARFKDFGSDQIQETDTYEPVTFRLDGEVFTCYSVIPGSAMLEFVSDADSGEGGRASESILRFFKAAMTEVEYERFATFIRREKRVTPIDLLAEISTWLVEVYSDRPTLLPSASPDGTSTTAPTSEAPASSEALIPTG
jgi:hypothetical protein